MSNYSDQLSLIKVHTSVDVYVAAKDFEDAERVVIQNYPEIVNNLFNDRCQKLEIHGYEVIDEIPETSLLNYHTPCGDEWGTQETCEYYTTVERNERMKKEQERKENIDKLIAGLDSESLQLLQDYFLENS